MKDEGKDGDRDFLQWDTISLMSLLGIYVIVSYYIKADKNPRYNHKITNQKFDIDHIKEEIQNLLCYQSDALHWNINQVEKIGQICEKALESYRNISKILNVEMHSERSAEKRISLLLKGKESFMKLSRELAKKAQNRESLTIQPKERVFGAKARLTIENYLGGCYYFTCDEVELDNTKNIINLIEAKHSKSNLLPSVDDIKDGLLKMILYTNLKEVKISDKNYEHRPILKLSTDLDISVEKLMQSDILRLLKKEAKENSFYVFINEKNIEDCVF